MTKVKLKEEVKKIATMDNVDLIKYQEILSMSNLDTKAWKFLIRAGELRFKELNNDLSKSLCNDSEACCDDVSTDLLEAD